MPATILGTDKGACLHACSILIAFLPDCVDLLVELQVAVIQLRNEWGICAAVPVAAVLANEHQIIPASKKLSLHLKAWLPGT